MSVIPILTPRQMLAALLKAGFKIVRQRGSHILLENPITGRSTTVAMHAKDLSRKMIKKILNQVGITTQEFLQLLGK